MKTQECWARLRLLVTPNWWLAKWLNGYTLRCSGAKSTPELNWCFLRHSCALERPPTPGGSRTHTHTHRQRPPSTTKLQRAAPRQQIHTHTHEWRKNVAAKYSRVVRKPPEIWTTWTSTRLKLLYTSTVGTELKKKTQYVYIGRWCSSLIRIRSVKRWSFAHVLNFPD